jgi:RND family efflux transporter MFP subunit
METGPVQRKGGRFVLYAIGAVMVLGAGVAAIYFGRLRTVEVAHARSTLLQEAQLGPRVEVATVAAGPTIRDITLLGDARPWVTATIFAKVSGYLRTVNVDKGDLVHTGQVVAEIDSAETDSQYASAVADLENRQKLVVRARNLLATGNIAPQAAELAETSLRMGQEAVRNLAAMRSYETLRAPFDGTVTARFADPGALLQGATTNQASSLPVLAITDTSRLRVGAYVEQRDVAAVHVGDVAEVADSSNPDRRVTARLSRTVGTLDPRTRTLYVEIDVDNRDGFLLPGSFAYVTLKVPVASQPQIPVSALLQRGGTAMVALPDADGVVHLRPVKVASTDGVMINIAEGVVPGERVAINVPNEVIDGARIRVVVATR